MQAQAQTFRSAHLRGHTVVILTSDRQDVPAQVNLNNRVALLKQLQQFVSGGWAHSLHDVEGFFEGNEERGYALVLTEIYASTTLGWLLSIAEGYKQDSILHINSGHGARIINATTGEGQYVGLFDSFCPVAEGTQPDAYSVIEGHYYQARW